nr:regulatory solute carrier protein family 1 member 1 isoform X1 [Pogona vitticeps]
MLLTVFCLRRDRSELTFSLQVDADFELQNFRALCELESGIPAAESQIVYAEQPLTDNHRSLASYGLKDGDVVILQQVENANIRPPVPFPGLPRIDFSSITVPGTSSSTPSQPPPPPPLQPQQQPQPGLRPRPSPPELPSSPQGLDNPALLRDMLLANPHELSLLKERNPPLAEALLSGDLERFTRVLVEQQQDRARREQERIRLFSADPFDLEAQAKIEEDIRQQNIEENMTIAMEEAPESFGQVVMLYINCKVNGHPVKAFVDSGAQMTIMSQACAERCNIMRLVDRRWAGIAKGVGTQKIIGRVHLAQVQIEGDFLPCSFSILEEQPMDMLLGLDMLKRHQCSIDLKKNVLVIGTTGSQTTFLPEGELPECARLAYGAGREDIRPEDIADQELAEALQKSVEDAENSDKETTSLGIPSVPSSDGFRHPARLPEVSPQSNDPASRLLDRSVSAPSVYSQGSSQAETAKPRAVKSVDYLHEHSVALESKELLPSMLDLSDHIVSANICASPAEETGKMSCDSLSLPSQMISEKAITCGSLQEADAKNDTLDLESPVEPGGQGTVSDTHSQTEELDVPLLLKQVEQHSTHQLCLDLKTCRKPENELIEPDSEEPLGTMAFPPSPAAAAAEPSLDYYLSDERIGTEGERRIFSPEKRRLEKIECEHQEGETLLEMDVMKEAFVAANNPLDNPNITSPVTKAECSTMNVELPKYPASLPVSDLVQTGNVACKSTDMSAMVGLTEAPSGGQLNSWAEEPGLSLTSALKELHQLLIVNSKQDFNVSQQEDSHHSVAVPQEQATDSEGYREEHEHTSLDCQAMQLTFPGYTGVESSGKKPGIEEEMGSPGMREIHRLAVSHEQDTLSGQGTSALNSSGLPSPMAFSTQIQGDECVEILSQHLSSSHVLSSEVSELNQPPSFSLRQRQSQSGQSPFSERMETSEDVSDTEFQRSVDELVESSPSLLVDSPQPPAVCAADIAQIVRAGFTPQEAVEALGHAGGNAELALLILLAKSIVVPT